ncbi:rhodanese-like domain-containing protein [Luteimonas viscosa]|uniref:Rhodanese-like domain-containing protein n=1 Tax=Luteimonas viscosa TaxID=1132694 RepID=A0A5D4XP87_9GAMM|nr:rhodanese-like domain-containing protein [Luteimonas viscosa]TYT26399.1 rhodanese-like domain-containing protein [Luteimonas viscosa]
MIAFLKALFGAGGPHVGPDEAVQVLNRGAAMLDVREPGEFAAGHADGAIHVPLGRIRARGVAAIDALALPEGTSEILLVCHSGMRSRLAQASLSKDPRRRYVNVDGGMAAWAASGLPVVRGH